MKSNIKTAIWRGIACRCPRCGIGKLFARFTTVNASCTNCGLDFTHHRADDAPPYIIIVLVGHTLVPLALIVERAFEPSLFVHFSLWMPLAVLLSLALLPPVKGLVIAIQWANEMHGFRHEP